MTKSTTAFYAVVYDNGDDSVEIDNFSAHAEALVCLKKEIDEWTNGTSWDREKKLHKEEYLDGEDYQIEIEIIRKDAENDEVYEPLECWDSETNVLEPIESRTSSYIRQGDK